MKSASGMRGIIEMGFTLCVGPGLKKREWCSVKIKQVQAAAVALKEPFIPLCIATTST